MYLRRNDDQHYDNGHTHHDQHDDNQHDDNGRADYFNNNQHDYYHDG